MEPRTKRGVRVTQADIAIEAGVSQTVVSLTLNGRSEAVSEDSRKAVLAAAQRLGYRRRSGNTRPTIVYIYNVVDRSKPLPATTYDFVEMHFGRVADCFARNLMEQGYDMILRPCIPGTDLTHWLAESNCAGVIWRGRDANLLRWIGERFPCVAVNRLDNPAIDTVIVDQEEGVRIVLKHLESEGHSKILLRPTSPYHDPLWQLRLRTFLTQLEGIAAPQWVATASEFAEMTIQGKAFSFLDYWIENGREATALITGDVVAMQIMVEARQRGILIPQELSLIGGENMSEAKFCYPQLTAMDDPWEAIARAAVKVLQDRIAHPNEPRKLLALAPQLIKRDSVYSLKRTAIETGIKNMN